MQMDLQNMVKGIVDSVLEKNIDGTDLDIVKKVQIDEMGIKANCINHPSLYSYWTSVWRISLDVLRRANVARKRYREDEDVKIRKNLAEENKKMTDTAIKREIEQTARYRELYDKYLDAQHQEGVLEGFVKSLEQRKDMLYSTSATLRKEMDTDMSLKEKKIDEHFSGTK